MYVLSLASSETMTLAAFGEMLTTRPGRPVRMPAMVFVAVSRTTRPLLVPMYTFAPPWETIMELGKLLVATFAMVTSGMGMAVPGVFVSVGMGITTGVASGVGPAKSVLVT